MHGTTKRLELAQFVDGETVQFTRDYPHPVDQVWAALTEPDRMRTWWVTFTTLELRAGGSYVIDAPGGNAFKGRLTEFEPPRLINFSGVTRFELADAPGGCRLTVTVKRWANGWSPLQLAGFHCQFEQLGLHLGGRTAEEIATLVRTWRHVYPAYEWLVRENVCAGDKVSERVHFGESDAGLGPKAPPTLDRVVVLLRDRPGLKVELAGHCDDDCSSQEAVGLAAARMEAVAAYLRDAGIEAARVMRVGGGNFHQLVPSDTEEGRAFNRRVELRPVY